MKWRVPWRYQWCCWWKWYWRRNRKCGRRRESGGGARIGNFIGRCCGWVINFAKGALSQFGKYGSTFEKDPQNCFGSACNVGTKIGCQICRMRSANVQGRREAWLPTTSVNARTNNNTNFLDLQPSQKFQNDDNRRLLMLLTILWRSPMMPLLFTS